MRVLTVVFATLLICTSLFAHATFTGYSGAPGTPGTCAAMCHGVAGGTVTIAGFPAQYVPDSTYMITIRKASGLAIKNFNASIRLATGSTNAGTIFPGDLTAVYDVSGETNGVHMSSIDHDSATFFWTAPAAGYGILRLYVGAHQGSVGGANTALEIASTEAPTLPGQASNPDPFDGRTGVSPLTGLSWSMGSGADFSDIYFGTDSIPPLLASWFEGVFFDPDPDLQAGATYYWHIDSRNANGVTPGPLWHFTVMNFPGPATDPLPVNGASNVPVDIILEWNAGSDAVTHDVYIGFSPDSLQFVANTDNMHWTPTDSLLYDTSYYWRVDERNPVGVDTGVVWTFHTEFLNAADNPASTIPDQYALGAAFPNPFNATVVIPFALPQAAAIRLAVYDLVGRELATLAQGSFPAGEHSVTWSSEGVGSGIYFVRLITPAGTFTRKIVALK